jgi:hypothetical protein
MAGVNGLAVLSCLATLPTLAPAESGHCSDMLLSGNNANCKYHARL